MNERKAPSIVAYVGLAAALVSLTSGIVAYRRATDERVARESYVTVTEAIERLSDESQANHRDIVALRAYLEREHVGSSAAASASSPPPIEERIAPVIVTSKGQSNGRPASAPPRAKGTRAPAVLPDQWPR